MHLFYEPDILTNGGTLSEDESKHCVKVLRHQNGDAIRIIDGKGSRVTATITEASSKACRVKIESGETEPPPPQQCHIAIAPTKSSDRFEWFLEKSTETGIDRITPLLCRQSERKQIKPQRLDRVITAATKQSLRMWRPQMEEMTPIKDFLQRDFPDAAKFIAYCETEDRKELVDELKKTAEEKEIVVLIGPEGDFSEEEISLAKEKGFIPVSLGPNRLRTETAGIAACMIVNLVKYNPSNYGFQDIP